jgi:hypothetical protein
MLNGAIAADRAGMRRMRSEGLSVTESANTPGRGNLWCETMVTAFIWDSERDSATGKPARPLPQGFFNSRMRIGLFDIAAMELGAQAPTFLYGSHPGIGVISGALKLTIPNNQGLRFLGGAALVRYRHSLLDQMNSLGGYRRGGTGFSPAGVFTEGPAIECKGLFDMDVLAKISQLPLKLMVNAGARIPLDAQWRAFSQYLVSAGIAYAGLSFDAFVEYSLEAFFHDNTRPKQFAFDWGWGQEKVWEVAFSENPMYLLFGGRYRYDNGVCLALTVPLLISANVGSTHEHSGGQIRDMFPAEYQRGVTDGFDPWFAQWQIIARLSFPLRYKQTAAEMHRSFLLMKNQRGGAKIDIDKRLQMLEERDENDEEESDEEKQRRLEEIRKRREEFNNSTQ